MGSRTMLSRPHSYLENYCKFLYYVCVIPFKPIFNCKTKSYTLQRNIFHNTLYLFSQMLLVLTLGHSLYLKSKQNVHSQPLLVFKSATTLFEILIVICWNCCFYRRSTKFVNFLSINISLQHDNDSSCGKFKTFVTIIAPFLLAFCGHIGAFYGSDRPIKLFFENNLPLLLNENSQLQNVCIFLISSMYCYLTLIGACNDILLLVLAISLNDFATKLLNRLKASIKEPSTQSGTNNEFFARFIVKMATELKAYFSTFNSFFSPYILIWFCLEISWLPTQFVNSITVSKHTVMDVASVVYTWISGIILVGIGVLFSEARKKVNVIKTYKHIFGKYNFPQYIQVNQFNAVVLENCMDDPYCTTTRHRNLNKFIKITLRDAIVKGGSFIEIDYKFLGSASLNLIHLHLKIAIG